MRTVTIVPPSDSGAAEEPGFRAVAGGRQASGRTMGEALDSLTAQLPPVGPTLVLIQKQEPDAFFTEEQHRRLTELMARRGALSPAEREEMEALIDAELDATVARTDSLVQQLHP